MDTALAESLAHVMIRQHGLEGEGWRFQWDHAKRRFGMCDYRRKVISLSRPLVKLNAHEHVINVILHEIAHALAPWHGHDSEWKRVARSIGCTGERCYGPEVVQPSAKWALVCPSCNRRWARHKRPPPGKYRCAHCRVYVSVHRRVSG